MDIRIVIIVIISFFSLTYESCNRLCPVASGNTISLTGGSTSYTPIKDSIKAGDTIFLDISIPEKLTLDNSSSTIDFSNAKNMKTDIRFTSLKGIQAQAHALDSFVLIKRIGMYSINPLLTDAAINISFIEQNGNYFFSIGCIAQKKGIYLITVSDVPYAHKNCDYASISIISKSSDSHLHYLKDIYYGGGAIFPTDSTHSYCFKVY